MVLIEREKKKTQITGNRKLKKENCGCRRMMTSVEELCVCVLDETVNKGETFQGQLSEMLSLSLQLSTMIHRWRQGYSPTFFHFKNA
jgi:hypothetical protein